MFSTKGDGHEFRDYLREVESAFAEQPFGRCELSKRQDWCLEAAFELSGVVPDVLAYTCKTRQLDASTLRDSIFQRLELIHFDAYIHVCAPMWVVAFEELRALTNSTEAALNPIELHRIYDQVWELGEKLQSESSLGIYSGDYRPWEEQRGLEAFYKKKGKVGVGGKQGGSSCAPLKIGMTKASTSPCSKKYSTYSVKVSMRAWSGRWGSTWRRREVPWLNLNCNRG